MVKSSLLELGGNLHVDPRVFVYNVSLIAAKVRDILRSMEFGSVRGLIESIGERK